MWVMSLHRADGWGGDEKFWCDLRDSNYERNVKIMFPFWVL